MTALQKLLIELQADQDQDRENARLWWRETSNADKMRVWDAIQVEHDDPYLELVTRLAQFAFTELALESGHAEINP